MGSYGESGGIKTGLYFIPAAFVIRYKSLQTSCLVSEQYCNMNNNNNNNNNNYYYYSNTNTNTNNTNNTNNIVKSSSVIWHL